MHTLSHLNRIAGGELVAAFGADPSITSLELDSSRVPAAGGLFAALPGTRRHGAAIYFLKKMNR